MASPDVFLSSPSRVVRRITQDISSSPELPSIQEMLSQKQPKKPTLRGGSKAAAIPENASTTFTSAGALWRSAVSDETQPAEVLRDPVVIDDADTSLSALEVPQDNVVKPRKPRKRKEEAKKNDVLLQQTNGPDSPSKDQPWKKYKSDAATGKKKKQTADVKDGVTETTKKATPVVARTKKDNASGKSDVVTMGGETPAPATKQKQTDAVVAEATLPMTETIVTAVKKTRKKSASTSRHFVQTGTGDAPTSGPKAAEKPEPAKRAISIESEPSKPVKKKDEANEPLQLEIAPARRMDWTPPTQKTCNVIDPTAVSKEVQSSAAEDDPVTSFQTMLGTWKYDQSVAQPEMVSISDEESSFLKKRKRIEPVVAKDTGAPPPETSPVKRKAPKKKARTITEVATRAYRPATQPEAAIPVAVGSGMAAPKADAIGKGKANARKRAPKVSKKKPPPPKPVLLSPSAALRQVANQDFLFGTSSQLAGDNSPSFLRNLQQAMRESNRIDSVEFTTPINSDAIEPPEERSRLWEAGARNEDGDLFDVEIIDITDNLPDLPMQAQDADPFGYVKGDEDPTTGVDEKRKASPRNDISFVNLSDILPSPGIKPVEISDEDSPLHASQISVCSAFHEHVRSATQSRDPSPSPRLATEQLESEERPSDATMPTRPSYELYTDAQLSKEITSYGFKPVKRRMAMIALLDQCWQSKARTGLGGVRAASTLSKAAPKTASASASASTSAPAVKAKRPRGRPRKDSLSEAEIQEPPPSAQPPSSPRPRGRPRKNTISPLKAAKVGKAKAGTSPKPTRRDSPSTPKRKAKSKIVVEIPDSDDVSEASTSPCSSPEPMFSPAAAVDLSLTTEEDAELSLILSTTDQQAAVYGLITKAITSAPGTTDPANPSWHEKILLYDPIVLEDLTAWLNSGQLTRIGYDGEVSSGLVKKWCESKSVCCLWKINLRGKERKRY